uniref:Uncharacterized protein n=1 Tax=Glossina austeni TaxID=7395 RepID=A0A1A9V4X5_GLOAU
MKLRIVVKNAMKLRKSLNLYNEIESCFEKVVSLYNGFDKLEQNVSDEENELTSSNSGSILPNEFDFIKGLKYLWNDALTASLFKGLFLAAAKIFSINIASKVLNHPQSTGQNVAWLSLPYYLEKPKGWLRLHNTEHFKLMIVEFKFLRKPDSSTSLKWNIE